VIRLDIAQRIVNRPTDKQVRTQISTKEEFENKIKESEIKNGIKKLEKLDIKGPDPKCPLNLSGIDLYNLRLEHVRLENCTFSRAILKRLSLYDVQMENCDFTDAIMTKSAIFNSVLNGVDFSNSDLSAVEMRYSKGTGVTMIGATLQKAWIEECQLTGWILADANVCKTKIYRCNVDISSFERTDLSRADIAYSKFEEVNFTEAHAEAPACTYKTTFKDVSWRGAKVHLQCKDTSFERGDFSHAKLYDSPFMRCTFKGPIELERCDGFYNLSECKLDNVNLLALEYMPDMMPKDEVYEREYKRHTEYQSLWNDVINWHKFDPDEPHRLTIHLQYYKKYIDRFDAEMRKHLRDKILTLATSMPYLQTEESRAQLSEIIALDDALTAAESNRSRGESVDTADSDSPAENQPPATGIADAGNRNNDESSFRLFA